MGKKRVSQAGFFDFLYDSGSEKYALKGALPVIFLSSLSLAYLIHRVLSPYFSVPDFISQNTEAEYPRLLAALALLFFAGFTFLLKADNKRVSVIFHHFLSLCVFSYALVRQPEKTWPEYENTLFMVSAVTALSLYAGWLASKAQKQLAPAAAFIERHATAGTVLACAAYFLYFTYAGLLRHSLFYTQMYDMAWENQALYTLSHYGSPVSTIESASGIVNWADHASFIYYLLAPFYRLFPRPEFLIIVQALFASAAGFLAFLLGKRVLRSAPAGLLMCVLFLLHPAVTGFLMQDFHPNTLGLVFFIGLLLLAERKNFPGSLAMLCLMALTREDMAYFAFFCGLFLIAEKKALGPINGWLYPVSAAAAGLAMLAVMKASGGGPADVKRFYSLTASAEGILLQLVANPVYALSQAFTADKLAYLAVFSAPFLFLFWRKPSAYLLIAPAMLFGVLSKYEPHYIVGYHYAALFLAASFIGLIYFLAEREKPVKAFLAVSLMAASLFMNFFYGNLLSKSYGLVYAELQLAPERPNYSIKGWQGRYTSFRGEPDPEAVKEALLINKDLKVAADYFFSAHVSSRGHIFQLSNAGMADIAVIRKGHPVPPGFSAYKETARWVFCTKADK